MGHDTRWLEYHGRSIQHYQSIIGPEGPGRHQEVQFARAPGQVSDAVDFPFCMLEAGPLGFSVARLVPVTIEIVWMGQILYLILSYIDGWVDWWIGIPSYDSCIYVEM